MKLFPIALVITFIPIEWRDYIWHHSANWLNVFSYFINTSPRTTSASLYQFHLGYVMILLVKRPQSKPVCSQDRIWTCKSRLHLFEAEYYYYLQHPFLATNSATWLYCNTVSPVFTYGLFPITCWRAHQSRDLYSVYRAVPHLPIMVATHSEVDSPFSEALSPSVDITLYSVRDSNP